MVRTRRIRTSTFYSSWLITVDIYAISFKIRPKNFQPSCPITAMLTDNLDLIQSEPTDDLWRIESLECMESASKILSRVVPNKRRLTWSQWVALDPLSLSDQHCRECSCRTSDAIPAGESEVTSDSSTATAMKRLKFPSLSIPVHAHSMSMDYIYIYI